MKNNTHKIKRHIWREKATGYLQTLRLRVATMLLAIIYILSGGRHPGIEGYSPDSTDMRVVADRFHGAHYVADVMERWEGKINQCTTLIARSLNVNADQVKKE